MTRVRRDNNQRVCHAPDPQHREIAPKRFEDSVSLKRLSGGTLTPHVAVRCTGATGVGLGGCTAVACSAGVGQGGRRRGPIRGCDRAEQASRCEQGTRSDNGRMGRRGWARRGDGTGKGRGRVPRRRPLPPPTRVFFLPLSSLLSPPPCSPSLLIYPCILTRRCFMSRSSEPVGTRGGSCQCCPWRLGPDLPMPMSLTHAHAMVPQDRRMTSTFPQQPCRAAWRL